MEKSNYINDVRDDRELKKSTMKERPVGLLTEIPMAMNEINKATSDLIDQLQYTLDKIHFINEKEESEIFQAEPHPDNSSITLTERMMEELRVSRKNVNNLAIILKNLQSLI